MKNIKKNTNNSIIKGIGNDIVEIDRLQKAIDRHGHAIIDRLFTIKEQEYCLNFTYPVSRFAGRFAAKEAISKALGTGVGEHLSWHDIEIQNDKKGKPFVILSTKIKKQFNNPSILVSISHSNNYASAVAIWC